MKDPESPCIRNCCLDDNDICMGCLRTVEEIMLWGGSGIVQKKKILENIILRRKKRESLNAHFHTRDSI